MRAVVLAAGFGTRLLPLTRVRPKALLPLWGVPMLEHALRLLRRWGVREVLVNGHHHADQIWEYLRSRPKDGLAISFSYEPEILGTGGVLKRAAWFLSEEPCWMLNADVAADLRPDRFRRVAWDDATLAAVWLHAEKGPRTVEMLDGRVREFRSERAGQPGTYTFCGLHCLDARVLSFIEEDGFASIITAYERAIQAGMRIAGVVPRQGFWADVGTPEQLVQAHREVRQRALQQGAGRHLFRDDGMGRRLRRKGVRVEGFVSGQGAVEVREGAVLRDVILLDGARVGRTGVVRDALVAPGVVVEGSASRLVLSADTGLEVAERDAVHRMGWRPEETTASFAAPRGSSRQFIRLCWNGKRAIVVRYDPKRAENRLYAGHARFLARLGLRVPRVRLDDPKHTFTVFDDLGDRDLLSVVRCGDGVNVRELYGSVLDQVRVLHTRGAQRAKRAGVRLMPAFTSGLYRWEREWFAEQFLRRHLGQEDEMVQAVLRELAHVGRHLLRCPRVLLHRDLQSSNIFLTPEGPAFIDFQGMRMGPAVYDLASLLCDPYVQLPLVLVEEMIEDYRRGVPNLGVDRSSFWMAAVQRLAQALGAYARLSRIPGNEFFADHIPTALRLLRSALSRSGLSSPALSSFLHTVVS